MLLTPPAKRRFLMRRSHAALLLLGTAACAAQPPSTAVPLTTPVASTELAPLEAAIRTRLAAVPSGEVAVAVIDTEGGRYLGINDRVVMHAASTMKVGVLIELYRQASVRGQSLETPLRVRSDFRSAADASTYELTAGDDSDRELYDHLGGTLPINELARRMIARSSNLATNLLIEVAVPDSINATLTAVGAAGMFVVRGVQDIMAFERGLNNTTTAEAFARALASLVHCSVLPEPYCSAARSLLEAQEFRDMIPSGLPPDVRSANKSGWIAGIRHDGAIIETGRGLPYVLVVMTRGLPDTAAAQQVARDVSALAWRALGRDGTLHRATPPASWPTCSSSIAVTGWAVSARLP
jgi:beta-lactamase class A